MSARVAVLLLVSLLAGLAAPAGAQTAKFAIGDRVQVSTTLVRDAPTLSGAILASFPPGVQGNVIGGPVVADGYTWWNINYDLNPDGWSDENYLILASSVSPSPGYAISISPTSVSPGGQVTISWTVPSGRPTNDWVGIFRADDPTTSYLWWQFTNGATSGSVTAPAPGAAGSYEARYVQAGTFINLARSNVFAVGTGGQAYLVKDIWPGGPSSNLSGFVEVNGNLFFAGDDGVHGVELWRSDGTAGGTVMVKDIGLGFGSEPGNLTDLNGTLFFAATDATAGRELWKSDGTAAGTVLVKDVPPIGFSSSPTDLTPFNQQLFFSAAGELWKSDGRTAGTIRVRDFPGSGGLGPSHLTSANGIIFFAAFDLATGFELWKSDGTTAGTVLVKDINPGIDSSNPVSLVNVNGTLFFLAFDATHGVELWKSDGTAQSTVLVKDIYPGSQSGLSSFSAYLTNVGGTLFFAADDGVQGVELWKSDGTDAGTVLVKDIFPGGPFSSSLPSYLTVLNGAVYFAANSSFIPGPDVELWRSDGTESGTVRVKDINPGPLESSPRGIVEVNGILFFSASDVHGPELWKSDGTEAGTELVDDIVPGPAGSQPRLITLAGSHVFFAANDFVVGEELWATAAPPPPGCSTDADCDDGNVCTDDACNLATGNCVRVNNTNPCDDGNACTTLDRCGAGVCVGGPPPAEICDNGLDDDCDGLFDCEDPDCTGNPVCGVSVSPPTITALEQFADSQPTPLQVGDRAFESVTFKAQVSDPAGAQVRLEVELRREGEAFNDSDSSAILISDFFPSGATASVTRYGLVPGKYNWRARSRAIHNTGPVSDWRWFSLVTPTDFPDFLVAPLPVILLPGIMGSEIQRLSPLPACQLWLPENLLPGCPAVTDLRKSIVGADIITGLAATDLLSFCLFPVPSGCLGQVKPYEAIETYLKQRALRVSPTFNDLVYPYPYDWRGSITQLVGGLRGSITTVLNSTKAPRVDIVAHSMGGLVAYRYLSSGDTSVRRLVTAGTPLLGSPEALVFLRYGESPPWLLEFSRLLEKLEKTIAHNSPGVYDLLPSREYFTAPLPYGDVGYIINSHGDLLTDYASTNTFLKQAIETVRVLDNSEYVGGKPTLNPTMVDNSGAFHMALDTFARSPRDFVDTQFLNIVGWNQLTTTAVEDRLHFESLFLSFYFERKKDTAGDGTVPVRSAAWGYDQLRPVTQRLEHRTAFVDLMKLPEKGVHHQDLLTSECIENLVVSYLDGDLASLPCPAVSDSPPTVVDLVKPDTVRVYLFSPADVHLQDDAGHHTGRRPDGSIEETVPHSVYSPDVGTDIQELTYVVEPGRRVLLTGRADGMLDLKVVEEAGGQVRRSSLFERILVNARSRGELLLDPGGAPPRLTLDQNGDGSVVDLAPLQVFLDADPREVLIDIKPGSPSNPVNLRANGVLPVAILATSEMDPRTVDPLSVRFGRNEVTEAHGKGHLEDVNRDGRVDLLLHFNISQAGILPDDRAACLAGRTVDGREIRGCDLVTITP